jgi:hypothetical protein
MDEVEVDTFPMIGEYEICHIGSDEALEHMDAVMVATFYSLLECRLIDLPQYQHLRDICSAPDYSFTAAPNMRLKCPPIDEFVIGT